MKRAARIVPLLAPVLLAACGSGSESYEVTIGRTPDEGEAIASSPPSEAPASPVAACVERGVAYFKEIGSYPALQSPPNAGRAAIEVAQERCMRTTTAF